MKPPAPSAAKLPQAQKPKPSPVSNQPQAGTRGGGWEKPANGSVQWSTTQGGLSTGINVQSGPCFKLPPGFAPSPAARAAGLNECN